MRILQTSDWHLGQTLHQFERGFEHTQFLSWLLDTLVIEQVDALLRQQELNSNLPLCIYFTDGYGSFPRTSPESPVLWMVMPVGLESTGFPFGDVARTAISSSQT